MINEDLDYFRCDAPNQLSQSLPDSRLVAGSHFVTQIWSDTQLGILLSQPPAPTLRSGAMISQTRLQTTPICCMVRYLL